MSQQVGNLTIVRGLPGSGKSTLAEEMAEHIYKEFNKLTTICEADLFHQNAQAEYNYRPELAKMAHMMCLSLTAFHLKNGLNVIVANTFTTAEEIKPYRDLAEVMGIELEVVVCTGEYESTHGVPAEVIEKMRERWEDDV